MSTPTPFTLWRYLALRYLVQIGIMAAALLALIYVFETFELMRRTGSEHPIPMPLVLLMSLLKLPETAQIIFPFVFLFSGLSLFWQLNRSSELVVMRAVGISAWQFLAPVALVAFLCGTLDITVLQPIGAASLQRYATLESQYLGARRRIVELNQQGLWLRDSDTQGQVRLLHAESVSMPAANLTRVMLIDLDGQGKLIERLDAQNGTFDQNRWTLSNGLETRADGRTSPFAHRIVATGISREELLQGFGDVANFAFWTMPTRIKTLAASGFPTRSLVLYYQNLLTTPLLWMAMALIAVAVSLTPHRLGRAVVMLGIGVGAGFFYFLFARYFEALTLTQRIPEILAAWVPVTIATLVPLTSLLQTEDG